jgi:hypothetical protein
LHGGRKIVLSENNYNQDFKIEKGIHPGKPESESKKPRAGGTSLHELRELTRIGTGQRNSRKKAQEAQKEQG